MGREYNKNEPILKLGKIVLNTGITDSRGKLVNRYSPLHNLIDNKFRLSDFTTEELLFDLEHPVDIIPQDSYDGAVNLILNDGKNPPRLINSRFSVQNDTEYLIPEHSGFKDSNIYDNKTFDIDTRLKSIYRKIPKLEYKGLLDFGNLHCGSYTFYFKLADVDGNEGEICLESGIVLVHIGAINDPNSIRMGMEEENAQKSVQFKLTNIDSGFNYVHVLFAKTSSGNDQAAATTYHKVIFDYPVVNNQCDITISGSEQIIGISRQEFYVDYADINSAKTQTVLNNVLLLGNVNKTIRDYDALKIMSWKIIPEIILPNDFNYSIGSLDGITYEDYTLIQHESNCGNYYNTVNVYNSVGYWPGEIYRFGIVYIFDDNSLSPVFNLLGCDLSKEIEARDYFDKKEDGLYEERIYEPGNSEVNSTSDREDYYFFNLSNFTNSKGVIKFPEVANYNYTGHTLESKPLGIRFNFEHIIYRAYDSKNKNWELGDKSIESVNALFKKHKIIGFFFVRLKRIPSILALGVVIGLTDRYRGSLPVIKQDGRYKVLSFIDDDRNIRECGIFLQVPNNAVSMKAMLVPDAELSEATFNLLFVSNNYCLQKIGQLTFESANLNLSVANQFTSLTGSPKSIKLTNVVEETSYVTNGEDFFSTIAGNANEPYKTSDIEKPWKWSLPQDLTESTTVVRGLWGTYVGLGYGSESPFNYGDVVNIKQDIYASNPEEAVYLDFVKRFTSGEQYYAITNRLNVSDLKGNKVDVYRGDCFTSLFTHRMYRNFIDPELPTNHLIVDPSCWKRNYGVRCTSEIILHPHSNLTSDSEGWYIQNPSTIKAWDWQTMLVLIMTGNLIGALISLKNLNVKQSKLDELAGIDITNENSVNDSVDDYSINAPIDRKYEEEDAALILSLPEWQRKYYPNGMANEIVLAFETHVTRSDMYGNPLNKKVNPKELESLGGFNLKAIFKSDDAWELHGLANINRSDINAVGLGQWITFPICSSKNISMRDVDFSNATELASFNKKRSFYPLSKLDQHSPLRDSNVINLASAVSVPDKGYIALPNVPFIKLEYFTRILCSLRDSASSISNEFKQIFETAYRDYDKQYGQITKLVTINNAVLIIFSHGLGLIQLDMSLADVNGWLPVLVTIINNTVGSIWKDSIISTDRGVYGVDSVAKKIWRVSNSGLVEYLSDHKMGKFLIDNLKMSEFVRAPYIGHINIKTHYNAFKHDVIFTYYNDVPIDAKGNKVLLIGQNVLAIEDAENNKDIIGDVSIITPEKKRSEIDHWEKQTPWSLCFNEDTNMFTTFYDWEPLESENIDNIWFSFDREQANEIYDSEYKSALKDIKLYTSVSESGKIIRRATGISNKDEYVVRRSEIDPAFSGTIKVYEFDKLSGKLAVERAGNENYIGLYFYDDDEESWYWRFCNIGSDVDVTISKLLNEHKSTKITQYYLLEKPLGEESLTVKCSDLDIHTYEFRDYSLNALKLYKHGQAGVYDNLGKIKPTNWYGKQHEFNFEFVVNKNALIQKIFNNLKMISNKAEPAKFEFEVVGEGYDWYEYKQVLDWIYNNLGEKSVKDKFLDVLKTPYGKLKSEGFPTLFNKPDDYIIKKLPWLKVKEANIPGIHYSERLDPTTTNPNLPHHRTSDDGKDSFRENSSVTMLVHDDQLNEYRIRTELLGNNIKKFGRLRGNMEYLEDLWDVEIRPISFRWAYLKDGKLAFSKPQETRLRDKYCKVKVRYSGEDLVVIQAILTMFDYSFA